MRPRPIEQRADSGRRPSADERSQLIDQLRATYQKALPKGQDSAEQRDQPIGEAPESRAVVIVVEMRDTGQSRLEAANGAASEEVSVESSVKRLKPADEFERVAIPGFSLLNINIGG